MKLVLLDGCPAGDSTGAHLASQAEALGASVERFILTGTRLAPCLGDFECWTKTPGLCRTRDAANDIAAAAQRADLLVLLSPVSCGGHGSALKAALDRLIGLLHPDFHDRDGLTRHRPRYARYAPILFVGCGEGIDMEAAALYRDIAAGNAINLMAPRFFVHLADRAEADWVDKLAASVDRALRSQVGEPFTLPPAGALAAACTGSDSATPTRPQRVAVLVGSARPKNSSTSERLATPLCEYFANAGIAATLIYASQFIKAGEAAHAGITAMLSAELLIVASPVYVDGLPALVVSALEQLARHHERHALQRIAGVLNCGYPEAVHNHLALRQLQQFARETGLHWQGGLGLGGGEATQALPPALRRHVLRRPRRALEMAAAALAAGHPVPARAASLMARPLLPAGLYRFFAALRWRRQLAGNGLPAKALDARPHAEQG